ncbi:DNA recombination protein RmuC [Bacteroidota bacterium]
MKIDILYLIIGLLIGSLASYLITKFWMRSRRVLTIEEKNELDRRIMDLQSEVTLNQERVGHLQKENDTVADNLEQERQKIIDLNKINSTLSAENKGLEEKLDTQKQEIEKLQKKFTAEFKNLANEILEEKTKKFTDQNKINISEILNPLKERIQEFQKKIEETSKEDIDRHGALRKQIEMLADLNQQMTKDAENLTKALRGESKTQGNWGEFILESILEKSGLVKDREYTVQESVTIGSSRLQPDVIVKLPDNKNIIIDSKVSLVAYERMVAADEEAERNSYIKHHIDSVRSRVKELSEKEYQKIYDMEGGLDFVLLFMPVEPAFGVAIQYDDRLFLDAYEKNIVIVSPSTLIATLRTISSIWRQEYQNRNALEIARQGGALYDKFRDFTEDLLKVGDNLKSTKKNYDLAMNKLSEGKGNLVTRSKNLKELGAKATKSIDTRLIDRAGEE